MEEDNKDQKDAGLGMQIRHENDSVQTRTFNQSQVGWQGLALDDQSLTITNRRK